MKALITVIAVARHVACPELIAVDKTSQEAAALYSAWLESTIKELVPADVIAVGFEREANAYLNNTERGQVVVYGLYHQPKSYKVWLSAKEAPAAHSNIDDLTREALSGATDMLRNIANGNSYDTVTYWERLLSYERTLKAARDAVGKPDYALAHRWNTGRLYAKEGQIITATIDELGMVSFYDQSRGVCGTFPAPSMEESSRSRETLRRMVMDAYDHNRYTPGSSDLFKLANIVVQ